MSHLTQKWKRQGYGNGTSRRLICVLGLLLSLMLLTNACGVSNQGRLLTPGPIGNGGVMLGETQDATGSPPKESSPLLGNGDLVSDESMYNPADSTEIFMSSNKANPVVGDGIPAATVQASPAGSGTDSSPVETPAAQAVPSAPSTGNASPESVVPVKPSPEATKDPLPATSATGPMQASADTGIIIRSGNILSTSEKEILLNELETELNGLFGAIDRVSAEQQAVQAE